MTATAPRSLGTFITKPGYWFVTGRNQAGESVAGVVKYSGTGRLPNAQQAVFVNGPNAKSLNVPALQRAIQQTGARFLYEIPATGSHTNLQSIGARAVGQGQALYTSAEAGVQPTTDLTMATLLVAAPFAASVAGSTATIGAAGAGAAGETIAGAGAAGETATSAGSTAAETAGTAGAAGAAGGAAGGAASKLASKAAGAVTGNIGKIAGGVAITALLTETGLWKGVAMVIAGAVLAYLALRQVAGAAA